MRSLVRLLSGALILFGSARLVAQAPTEPLPGEETYRKLAEAWEGRWEQDPSAETATEFGLTLQALGMLERVAGKPEESLQHLERACELLREHAPDQLPPALEAKAITLQDLGKLGASERDLREVLAARAPNDPDRPATLDHLALNLLHQGRYPEVRPLLDEALGATPGHDLSARARRLSYRARLLHTLGNHARAAATLEEALRLPFEDPELRLTLDSELALAQLRLGNRDAARAGLNSAAERAKELYRETPFRAVPYLNNLGALDLEDGEPEAAEGAFREALGSLEAQFGPDHPALIRPLNNLGVALQELGRFDDSDAALKRAAELQGEHLPRIHLRVAETARNIARNALLRGDSDATARIDEATRIGLELLEELVRTGTERERLNFLERFDLLSLPCADADAARIANLLLASKSRLFDALIQGEETAALPTWEDVQAALPADGAYIDACHFVDARAPGTTRYGAVVILPRGSPQWVQLGTGDELGRWLGAFRRRLGWRAAHALGNDNPAPALKLRSILRSIDDAFWEPLERKLPETTRHVAFSPDGALHFLPLPALVGSDGTLLCQRLRQVTTLASGRDLLLPAPTTRLPDSPWAVLTIEKFPPAPPASDGDRLGSLLASLQPLPGTHEEARRLADIAPKGSRFLENEQVSETGLAGLEPTPAVLHLGCHAFFLEDPLPSTSAIDFDERAELLTSGGLVLYRGTQRVPGGAPVTASDDLLFPAEIARLPLAGTRLVTLSSCESGIGTPVSGEGLLGLRRAFALAGAREVMVALWPVADDSTPRFMDRFYRLALASDRPGQALWQAQSETLADPADEESFELSVLRYAPFVLSQSGPLRGGPAIEAKEAPAHSRPWYLWLTPLPLLIFVFARWIRARRLLPLQ